MSTLDDFGRFSNPAMLILISLAGGEKHGYAMIEDIEAIAGTRLGPGTLYGAIQRLEERGFIQALPQEARRRPYKITASGIEALREQLDSLRQLSQLGLERLGES